MLQHPGSGEEGPLPQFLGRQTNLAKSPPSGNLAKPDVSAAFPPGLPSLTGLSPAYFSHHPGPFHQGALCPGFCLCLERAQRSDSHLDFAEVWHSWIFLTLPGHSQTKASLCSVSSQDQAPITLSPLGCRGNHRRANAHRSWGWGMGLWLLAVRTPNPGSYDLLRNF